MWTTLQQDGSLEYAIAHFPHLIYVKNTRNVGYAAGIDAGARSASGLYVAPLNLDTQVDAKWLGSMVSFLEHNPRAGAVNPKILLFDDRGRINAMGHNLHFSGLSFCRNLGQLDKLNIQPQQVSGLSGCSYLIRKDLWDQVSDLLVDSFMANDDAILSWILTLMDYHIYVVPSSVVYHKYKLFMDPQKFYRLEKGRGELVLSSLGRLTLLLMSPCLVFIELLQWAYCVIKGKAYIKAKLDVYKYLCSGREMRRNKRNRIEQIRKISDFEPVG